MAHAITKEYLKSAQYATTRHLEARIKIHQLFSTNPESIHAWVGRHLIMDSAVAVLEVGCGTGNLWKECAHLLPEGSTWTLTDFSDAMVEKARKNMAFPGARFEVADIENLSYEDDSFDVINAHHVVYHANDKDRAFAELKRVLRPGGYVTITTNSAKHMRNVYDIGQSLDANFPADRIIDSFTEEMADRMLPGFFSKIDKFVQEDLLKVTDILILLDYVASGVAPRKIDLAEDFYERYANIAQKEIDEKGYFGILKRSPLYLCWA